MMTWAPVSLDGFSSTGFMSVCGATPAATACRAWARPISPPSAVTALLSAMFCGLNGTTATPWRLSRRHRAATTVLLPASDVVPCTIKVEKGKSMSVLAALTRRFQQFAQRRRALDHAGAGPVDQVAVDGEQVALPRRLHVRILAPQPRAALFLLGRAEDGFGIGLQHRFRADDGRRDLLAGEDVLAAAYLQRIADDMRAVERVQRLVPHLVEDPYRRAVGITRSQRRQLLAQVLGRRVGCRLGAQQLAHVDD